MTLYELVQRKADGIHVVSTVEAGTKAQATRKLFRRISLSPIQGTANGYSVEVAKPQGQKHG